MKDEKSIKNKLDIKQEIHVLEERVKLAKSFQERLDLKDRITKLYMDLNEVKRPTDFEIACVGCGS